MKIPATHPVVRAMALEAAEEVQTLYRRNDPTRRSVASGLADGSDVAREVVAAHVALLTALTPPASRDAWTRWLRNRSLRAAQESGEAFTDPSIVSGIFRDTDRLRDNPEALAAAVCAALETA